MCLCQATGDLFLCGTDSLGFPTGGWVGGTWGLAMCSSGATLFSAQLTLLGLSWGEECILPLAPSYWVKSMTFQNTYLVGGIITNVYLIANIHWIMEKAREFQKKIYFCFIVYAKAFDCVDHNKLWKILKEMGIPDHLTCLLRNLYAGQEATVRTGHGTTDLFQIGKGVHQGSMLTPCLFNLNAEYIMWNAMLDKHKLESRLPGEIAITSDVQMIPPLWQKVKRN